MNRSEQKTDWFEPGLHFECTQCGNCCTGPPGFVWFDEDEREAMAAYLELSVERFNELYVTQLQRKESLSEVMRDGQYDCIFLERDEAGRGLCRIYPVRPQQCQTWPFWPENLVHSDQWKRAARNCPGMIAGGNQPEAVGNFYPAEQVRLVRDSNPPM